MGAEDERGGAHDGSWDAGWWAPADETQELAAPVALVRDQLRDTLLLFADVDRALRALPYTHQGHFLRRRGLVHGQSFTVTAAAVLPGDLCLASSDAGELAVGVARYEGDGTFSVWSAGCGPAVRLSRGEHVRPVGCVAPLTGMPLPLPLPWAAGGYQMTG